jgi:hypothetical protein
MRLSPSSIPRLMERIISDPALRARYRRRPHRGAGASGPGTLVEAPAEEAVETGELTEPRIRPGGKRRNTASRSGKRRDRSAPA